MKMELMQVRAVKRRHLDGLMSRQNVVACGVGHKNGNEEPSVVISVTEKVPTEHLSAHDVVPQKLSGVRTDVIEVGVIKAQQAKCGVSVGHIDSTAGTLGCIVTKLGEEFLLSNCHVFALCGDAEIGDPIVQPAPHDGGTLINQIATLEDFVPIDFGFALPDCPVAETVEKLFNKGAELLSSGHRMEAYKLSLGANTVDAAIARPLSENLVSRAIVGIGEPKGIRDAQLGMEVQKGGRTTGVTRGKIVQFDVTAKVNYGLYGNATFHDQLMATGMSQPGDSGSAMLDMDGYVVGLLFAGSGSVTIMNPIQFVLDEFGVEIAI